MRTFTLIITLVLAALLGGCSTAGKFDNVLSFTLPGTPARAFTNSTYAGFSLGTELRKEDAERLQEMVRQVMEYQLLLNHLALAARQRQ